MCEPWEDLPIRDFIWELAKNFYAKAGYTVEYWLTYARGLYLEAVSRDSHEKLQDYDWCAAAAREMAEEDMQYWD